MLTPMDIQNRQLQQQMGGYDATETNNFLNEIIGSYNELYKENQALKEKITTLSEGIQYYKKMEGNSQIDALRAEAQAQAEVTKAKANRELEETRNHVRKLIQSYENYRLQFKKLAETQIDMVESESFSIFVPELDELMNGSPSADSVMDDPGIIPINIGNIGSPTPFVEPPEESVPETPASSASVVEELPVSIAIPVSSTEPFTAPPADDTEVAPSIDLNVSSSVIGNMENTNSSLEVDLGTGSAINIPISAGAFVSPDDDIPEENTMPDGVAASGAESPMTAGAESPFMDVPMASTGEIPGAGTIANSVEPVASSIEVPIAPSNGTPMTAIDGMIPSMDPTAASGQPATATEASPFVDGSLAEPAAFNTNAAQSPFVESTADNNAFTDIPISQNPAPEQVNPAMPAMNNAFIDTPAQTPVENNFVNMDTQAATPMQMDPAAQADPLQMSSPITDPLQQNPAAGAAMNNAFIDMPIQSSPGSNPADMGMGMQPNPLATNEFAANPLGANPMQAADPMMAVDPLQMSSPMTDPLQQNPAMQQNELAADPAAGAAMNNAFIDTPMQSSPGSNPADMGMGMQPNEFATNPLGANPMQPADPMMAVDPLQMSSPMTDPLQQNPAMQQNELVADPAAGAAMNNAFIDTPMQSSPGSNPADPGMGMQQNEFAANPLGANPMQTADPMQAINPMQAADPMQAINPMQAANSMQMDPAAAATMNNAFMDIPGQVPVESNPANMGMQQNEFAANPLQDNPFIDAATETPVTEMPVMDPAQTAGGMPAAAPQPAAPADNNSLMADPMMDVGSMFDSPINDVPAAEEPAPAQNTQSVESLLDINPFNFIDPE